MEDERQADRPTRKPSPGVSVRHQGPGGRLLNRRPPTPHPYGPEIVWPQAPRSCLERGASLQPPRAPGWWLRRFSGWPAPLAAVGCRCGGRKGDRQSETEAKTRRERAMYAPGGLLLSPSGVPQHLTSKPRNNAPASAAPAVPRGPRRVGTPWMPASGPAPAPGPARRGWPVPRRRRLDNTSYLDNRCRALGVRRVGGRGQEGRGSCRSMVRRCWPLSELIILSFMSQPLLPVYVVSDPARPCIVREMHLRSAPRWPSARRFVR